MNWKILLRYFFSIGLLAGLFYYLDTNNVLSFLLNVTPLLIVLAFFYFIAMFFISTFNIKQLLKIKYDIPFWELFRYNLYSWAIGQFTIGKLGFFSIAYFLKKYNVTVRDSVLFVFINQVVTLLILLPFTLIGLYVFIPNQANYVILSGIILILVLLILREIGVIRKLYGFIVKKFEMLLDVLPLIKKSYYNIFVNFCITIFGLIFSAFILRYYFMSYGFSLPYLNIFIVSAFSTIISAIPISLAGLGIYEASVVYLFSLYSVDPSITFVIYLLFRFCRYILGGIILLYMFIFYKK